MASRGHAGEDEAGHAVRLPSMKLWIVIGAVLLFLALILTAPLLRTLAQQMGPVKGAFREYSSALVRRDLASAYRSCSPEFQQVTNYDEFRRQYEKLESDLGSLRSVEQGKTIVTIRDSPSEWRAEIHARLVFERGAVALEHEFRYDGTKWMLYGYKRD